MSDLKVGKMILPEHAAAVLLRRLNDPLVVALCDEGCPLPKRDRRIGISFHLLGDSPDELASRYRITLAAVWLALGRVRDWHRETLKE